MVTNFILVFKTKLIKSYFYFIQHIKFWNRISILLEIIRVTNYISTFIHLITLQTFSLRHADVEHQKSRFIYPTYLPSELQGYPQRMRLQRRLYGICLVRVFLHSQFLVGQNIFLCLIERNCAELIGIARKCNTGLEITRKLNSLQLEP